MNLLDKYHMVHRFWRYRLRKEAMEIRYMRAMDLEGKTVLDIGANKGVYTYWLSKSVGRHGRVIAFEPQPELVQHLESLKRVFDLRNVTIVAAGLSDSGGKAPLYRKKAGAGDASFNPEDNWQVIEVNRLTLDDYINENPVDDLAYIKCDAEGHELAVFLGGIKTIKRFSPTLQIECHHRDAVAGKLFALLKEHGYAGFFMHAGRKTELSEFSRTPYRKPETDHRNYLFERA